jgi:hypothetical protein
MRIQRKLAYMDLPRYFPVLAAGMYLLIPHNLAAQTIDEQLRGLRQVPDAERGAA